MPRSDATSQAESYTEDFEDFPKLPSGSEEPVDFWVSKQRELVTSVVDYNLSTVAQLVTSKGIDVSPKYQRRFRWDDQRQSKLIESFLMNVPVPPIFLNEDEYGEYSVIDGKQRITTVERFLNNQLALTGLEVFSDLESLRFSDLPTKLQTVLRTRPTLRAVIVLRQSDPAVKYEVFQRLNTGGVRLNPQEIRNSAFPGTLNDLVLELSETSRFHALLRVKNKTKSAIYQEMRDAEFVVRFFTFMDCWESFKGGLRRNMDEFMDRHKNPSDEVLASWRARFNQAVANVSTVFGDDAFKRWQPERGKWRSPVVGALFDVQMFALQGRSKDELVKHSSEIVRRFQSLFEEADFILEIDSATPIYFKTRIERLKEIVDDLLSSG